MRRGEIRWYTFQAPDKRRPVVVLTRDSVIGYLGETTIAPVTTTIREIPSEVVLGVEDGMPRECAINCDHIQTVTKAKIGALVATLSQAKMRELGEAVRFALDL
jgi:mRNA interferase MazF